MLDKEIHVRFTLRSVVRWDWFGPVSAVTAFVIFVAVVYACWDTSSVAAWVQAVGSVLAILVAIWVSNQQERSQDRERKRREFSYMIRVIPLVSAAAGQITDTCRCINRERETVDLNVQFELLELLKVELEQFEYAQFADDDVADGWLQIKSAVTILMTGIKRTLGNRVAYPLINTEGFVEKARQANAKVALAVVRYGDKVGESVWRNSHP